MGDDRKHDSSMRPVSRSPRPRPVGKLAMRRRMGWAAGGALSGLLMLFFMAPEQKHLRAPGKMNVGHEALDCESCHTPAPGTTRQQLQANVRYLLGLRKQPADFGNRDVTNADCLACHERPFDRHPVFRFNEPRFEQARRNVGAHRCESCHDEHKGLKVTAKATYCAECHADLQLERDPIDVPHAELVAGKQWQTCLGCHDFHGNHERSTPTRLSEAIDVERINEYFAGSPSPYGERLKSPPRKTRKDAD